MFVEFSSLSPDSRLWIFHAKRKFTPKESEIISTALAAFTDSRKAHGTPLTASFDIRLDQFIILAVDEAACGASGCSIDGSTRVIKDLEQTLGLDLFDRTQAFFQTNEGILTVPLSKIKEAAAMGQWDSNTTAVNTLVATKGELDMSFLVPAGNTWLKRYLPATRVPG